ncbi:MAG: hypothetical protein Q4C60_09545 [Eubacteriales bacterium]|nr:hypothetical protein [Eubacteriales bacterium]
MPKTTLAQVNKDRTRAVVTSVMAYQAIDYDKVSRMTGIPRSTFFLRMSNPDAMKMDEFRRLIKALKLTDEQIIEIVRSGM